MQVNGCTLDVFRGVIVHIQSLNVMYCLPLPLNSHQNGAIHFAPQVAASLMHY